jgi:phospholipid/cholesterol/gamma-HCH transport system substrate-binding protein
VLLSQDIRLARRVGALTLLALAAVSAGFVFLLDRGGLGPTIRFRVMFRHTAGLRERAPLIVAGRPVGRIEAIAVMPHGAPGPLAGEVGVAVTVEVARDDRWKVPAASTIFVASRGPLSDRYLEVAPPDGAPGPAIGDGAELRGVDPPSLDNVLQHTWTNLTTFQQFVDAVGPELAALRGQLAGLADHLDELDRGARAAGADGSGALAGLAGAIRGLAASAARTYDSSLGGALGVARLAATAGAARQTVAELRAALDAIAPRLAAATQDLARIRGRLAASDPVARAERVVDTLRGALDKLDPLLAAGGEIAARLARGEGSIGRLMTDPEFPEDTKELGKIIKRHPWRVLEKPAN